MQPPQSLYHPLDALNVRSADQPDNLLLDFRVAAQEALDELSVDEPERLLRLAHHAAEGTELVERHLARRFDIRGDCGLQTHEEVLMLGVNEREEVDRALHLLFCFVLAGIGADYGQGDINTYRCQEGLWSNRHIGHMLNIYRSYAVDHLAQRDLTCHLQPSPVVFCDAVDVPAQYDEVALCVTLKVCILCDVRDTGTPDGLVVASHLGQRVWKTIFAFLVLNNRYTLHEI